MGGQCTEVVTLLKVALVIGPPVSVDLLHDGIGGDGWSLHRNCGPS